MTAQDPHSASPDLAGLRDVRERLARAADDCDRDPAGITLVCVSKTFPTEAIEPVLAAGERVFGENRVQEGVDKRAQTTAAVRWDLIGHLQSNKAKLAATHFDRIQSVDSEKLLRLLDRAAAEAGRILPVLLQVNSGHDPAKSGVEPEESDALLAKALSLPNIRVEGLMAIAPLSEDPDVARRAFASLREIRDHLASSHGVALPVLSMGMSGDLEAAIREGSTLVRVGSALFGARV